MITAIQAILMTSMSATLPSDVPAWIVDGIMSVESRSFRLPNGYIKWVDKKRGHDGERGAFQCTWAAFHDVRVPGESFSDLEKDPIFAEVIACRYLAKLKDRYGTWRKAIESYNAGPGHKSAGYYHLVLRYCSKTTENNSGKR